MALKGLIALLALTFISCAKEEQQLLEPVTNPPAQEEPKTEEPQPTPKSIPGEKYRTKYALKDARQKLVDNRGVGYDNLYGTRNFRAVLNGVYYRGGANNSYNKYKKRSNSNPLPPEGLENLCKEGFSDAVYLYSTNYKSAEDMVQCKKANGETNTLRYTQISPLAYKRADQQKLLSMIHARATDTNSAPIYDHCWNGWHASGFVGAITLMQFCDFSPDQAVAYWNVNTDGANGPGYEGVRKRIRAFVPFSEFQIDAESKKAMCPDPQSLRF